MMTTLTCSKCGTQSRKKHANDGWDLLAAYSRWVREGWTSPRRWVEVCPVCS